MNISRRTQQGIIALYAVSLFTAAVIFALPVTPQQSAVDALILAIPVAPAIPFLLGVKWCRFVIGVFSVMFFGLFAIMALPFVVRPVERIQGFWFLWMYFEIVFIATSIASFAKPLEVKNGG